MKPRIAIPVPTAGDFKYNALNWPAFADAVCESGGEPVKVELTLLDGALAEIATGCSGVVLPGSPADVETQLYGQVRDTMTADHDGLRERVDRVLLEDAWTQQKPLLGVCFGMQMMNVWRGGTLVQHLAPMPVNHSAGRSVFAAHGVTVEADSCAGRLVAAGDEIGAGGRIRLMVNSSHHQAVAIPGAGLRVIARSMDDGVIEAIEATRDDGLFLGVQWHPERTYDSDGASRSIFDGVCRAAAEYFAASFVVNG